jgi:hypothetical protein
LKVVKTEAVKRKAFTDSKARLIQREECFELVLATILENLATNIPTIITIISNNVNNNMTLLGFIYFKLLILIIVVFKITYTQMNFECERLQAHEKNWI